MSSLGEAITQVTPTANSLALNIRPIFSGSDPNVCPVQVVNGGPINVSITASITEAITGTVGVTNFPATQNVSGSAWTPTVNQSAPSSGAHSVIVAGTSSVDFQAAKAARKGLNIYNNSDTAIFVFLGSGASSSKFSFNLPSASFYELPFPVYTGIITGIWATSGSGDAQVDELT
jgi:hypothetical protein